MLSADPVLQEFHGRGVAERGMLASPVVERLDVVEQVVLCFGPRTVAGAMHPLILQTVEEALRRRVVPAISLAAHQAPRPSRASPRGPDVGQIGRPDLIRCLRREVPVQQVRRHLMCLAFPGHVQKLAFGAYGSW